MGLPEARGQKRRVGQLSFGLNSPHFVWVEAVGSSILRLFDCILMFDRSGSISGCSHLPVRKWTSYRTPMIFQGPPKNNNFKWKTHLLCASASCFPLENNLSTGTIFPFLAVFVSKQIRINTQITHSFAVRVDTYDIYIYIDLDRSTSQINNKKSHEFSI